MDSWRFILLSVLASLCMAAPARACEPPTWPYAFNTVPDRLKKKTDVVLVAKVADLTQIGSIAHCDRGIDVASRCAEYSVTLKTVKVSRGTFRTQISVFFPSYAFTVLETCYFELMNGYSEGRLEESQENGKAVAMYLSFQEVNGQKYYRLEEAYTHFRTRRLSPNHPMRTYLQRTHISYPSAR